MLARVQPWLGNAPDLPFPVALAEPAAAPPDALETSREIPQRSRNGFAMVLLSIPVIAAIAWALLIYVPQHWRTPAGWPGEPSSVRVMQPPRTIAVLPLLDISPNGGNEYLGDGLAEELSSRLSRIPGLRVAAQTSTFAFKGRHTDVRQIAQFLGVRNVLEGSVRRDGEQLRVTAQLIDAQSGYNVWSQTYDRTWRDLSVIQDDLAHSIVDALQLVLSTDVKAQLGQQPTRNLAAFDLYLAGLAHLRRNKATAEAEQSFREVSRSIHNLRRRMPDSARPTRSLTRTRATPRLRPRRRRRAVRRCRWTHPCWRSRWHSVIST